MSSHEVIIGPPGTGKTTELVTRVFAYFCANPGRSILFCSHTRAAAQEAKSRWGTGDSDFNRVAWDQRVATSTLHSYCFGQIGAARAQTVDDAKLTPFMDEFGLDLQDGELGRQYLEIISRARSKRVGVFAELDRTRCFDGTLPHFEAFFKSYEDWKKQYGYLDFCDMLLRYLDCRRGSGLSLLAVDEAQDLTPLHWQVVRHIMKLNPDCLVMVAGDEDQSIYAYMGADPTGIHTFHNDFQTRYQVLEQSFRVPRLVYQVASRVIERIDNRVRVVYKPREAEGHYLHFPDAGYLTKQIRAKKDNLVLYSDRFVREELERDLIYDLIPYTVVSGRPGPLDINAGKALKLALAPPHGDAESWAASRNTIKAALSSRGATLWDSIGYGAVMDLLAKRDLSLLRVPKIYQDYLANVDLSLPVEVRLSTIHGAKGREGQVVHLALDQSNSAFMHSLDNPDNQHRLFYVGATRAKEELITYEGANHGYDING